MIKEKFSELEDLCLNELVGSKDFIKRVYDYSLEDLMLKKRERPLVYARHSIFYALRNRGFSLTTIGTVFNLDHTTIIHGLKNIDYMFESRLNGFATKEDREILALTKIFLRFLNKR